MTALASGCFGGANFDVVPEVQKVLEQSLDRKATYAAPENKGNLVLADTDCRRCISTAEFALADGLDDGVGDRLPDLVALGGAKPS
jgi:hypothetical protein